jgi:hypothetical protein
LVEGLRTTLMEEGTGSTLSDGRLLVRAGPAVGQAPDGALIVASDSVRLTAALEGSERYLTLGLPPEGAGGFALEVRAPIPVGFEDIQRVSGAVQLGRTMDVDVAVRLRVGVTAEAAAIARAFARLGASAPRSSMAKRPLEHAEILPRRPDEASVHLSWEPEEVEAGAAWLGSLLEAQFARPALAP